MWYRNFVRNGHLVWEATREFVGRPCEHSPRQKVRALSLAELEERLLYSASPAGAVVELLEPVVANSAEFAQAAPVENAVTTYAQPADINATELVIVDAATPDYEQLTNALFDAGGDRDFEILVIQPDDDGIEVISNFLQQREDIGALHIVSHGTDGNVRLGNMWLNSESLPQYAGMIGSWYGSLSTDADILFYGCDLAQSENGRLLIDSLHILTDADVAASIDVTGNESLGGNWQLEFTVGSVETNVAWNAQTQASWQGILAANVAPTHLTPYAGRTDLDQDLSFSTAALNAITVSDTDAGSSQLVTQLSVTEGTLQFAATTGIISGNGTKSLEVTGTLAEINTALDGLTYTPDSGFRGEDALTITTNDLGGGSGTGGPLSTVDIMPIYVSGELQIADSLIVGVNNRTTSHQETSAKNRGSQDAVAVLPDGRFVVTWSSFFPTFNSWGVQARIFNADGSPVGGEFEVNLTGGGDQLWSSVVADGDGNFAIAWTSANQDGDGNGVYLRRFDSSGNAIDQTHDLQIATTTSGDQENVSIAANKAGDIVVAWEGNNGSQGIFFKQFDMTTPVSGGLISAAERTATSQADATAVSVDIDSQGNFILAWQENDGLYFSSYNAAGQQQVPRRKYDNNDSTTNTQETNYQPDIVLLENGQFVSVNYSQTTVFSAANHRTDVVLYDADGSVLDINLLPSLLDGGAQVGSVAKDDLGNLLVITEFNDDARFQVARYNTFNNKVSEEYKWEMTPGGTDLRMPSVAMTDPENFVFVWTANGGTADSSEGGIYAYVEGTDSNSELQFSTTGNGTAPGYSGTSGSVIQFLDGTFENSPDFGLTNGTVSSAYGFANDVDALHVVSRDVVFHGSQLRKGDVLFSLSVTTTDTDPDDIIHMRYDGNNFQINLLVDGVAGANGDINSLTLVERDTQVGSVLVEAGSIIYSGDGSNALRVYDHGTQISTDLISNAPDTDGLELIERDSMYRGAFLAEGTLLVSTSVDINAGDNTLAVSDEQIFAIDVQTTDVSGTVTSYASLFFDGADVGLLDAADDIDALTLPDTSPRPEVTITGSGSIGRGANYEITLDSTELLSAWIVDWGDGNVERFEISSGTVSHAYSSTGHVNIRVTAIDMDGNHWNQGNIFLPGSKDNSAGFAAHELDLLSGELINDFASGADTEKSQQIEFGPNGSILVVSQGTDKNSARILEYDRSGTLQGVFADDDSVKKFGGVVFGPDGYFYAADFDSGDVLRFDLNGGTSGTRFLNIPTGGSALKAPEALQIGSDGLLYIADSNKGRIDRYDLDTGDFVDHFITGLSDPRDFAFDSNGQLFIADHFDNQVWVYDVNGVQVPLTISLAHVVGVELLPDDTLMVVADDTDTIWIGDSSDYTNLRPLSVGGLGIDATQFTIEPSHQVLVNDAPKAPLLQPGLIVPEDSAQFNVSIAPHADDVGTVTHYYISEITGGDLYAADGVTQINAGDFVSVSDAPNLVFQPTPNFHGTASFVAQASRTGFGLFNLSAEATASITVTPVIDTPAITDATTEAGTQTISGLVITPNAADTEVTHFQIQSFNNGSLYLNDGVSALNAGDFITVAEAAAGLKFTPSGLADGNVTVQAATGPFNGLLGGSSVMAVITVNHNNRPVLTPAAPVLATTDMNTTSAATAVSTLVGSSITDADGGQPGIAIFETSGSGDWEFRAGSGAWQSIGTVQRTSALLLSSASEIRYQPGGAGETAQFKFVAWDASGTESVGDKADATVGGADSPFSAVEDLASLSVTHIAAAPSVTDSSLTEDTQTTNGLVITPHGNDVGHVTAFQISGLASGTLFLADGTTAISNGDMITLANGAAGLRFTPDTNMSGTTTFEIRASLDGTTTGLGPSSTAAITVAPVNDPPESADSSFTVDEDSTYVLTSANFPFSDVDAGDSLQQIRIVSFPSDGKLFYDSIEFSSLRNISVADFDAGRVTFTPDSNFSGSTSFEFLVADSVSFSNTLIPYTMVANVTEVNDLPTISLTNTVTSIAENSDNSNRIRVADLVIQDDAVGDGILSLAGADAGVFELENNVLYLEANTLLDFEAPQNSYSVTVNFADSVLGIGPNGSVSLTLNVTDVLEQTISGAVYLDEAGDGSIVGDAKVAGTSVFLYRDDGDGEIDSSDQLVASTVTDSAGDWSFVDWNTGVYWAVIDSKTVTPAVTVSGDIWAQQTYAEAGAAYFDTNTSSVQFTTTTGGIYGGLQAESSDDASSLLTAQHVMRADATTSDALNLETAFSFNVVTNTLAGDSTDHDGASSRTVQGSLRQFIQNANAISGANHMRFVPLSDATIGAGGDQWWTVHVTESLPAITDAGTTIDGRAWSSTDSTRRNSNTEVPGTVESIGTGADGVVGTGDEPALTGVDAPELEIVNNRAVNVVDVGLDVQADSTTIQHTGIYGFSANQIVHDPDSSFGNIRVGLDPANMLSGVVLQNNVVGFSVSGMTAPDPLVSSGQSNINIVAGTVAASSANIVSNNVIAFAGEHGIRIGPNAEFWTISSNEISGNATRFDILDGIRLSQTANTTITQNRIVGHQGAGVDIIESHNNSVVNNTIINNGIGGRQTPGVRIGGNNNVIHHNRFIQNRGNAVLVLGDATNPAINNSISQNSFEDNGAQPIDLDANVNRDRGDGGSPNDGTTNNVTGNLGLDFPEISLAERSFGTTTIQGTTSDAVRVEFYEITSSGNLRYIDEAVVASDAFEYSTTELPATSVVTAIAFDANGNTSEFSPSHTIIGNRSPQISVSGDISIAEGQTDSVSISISDFETPAEDLTVSVLSGDGFLFPAANLVLSGTGGTRTLHLTAATNLFGTAEITLTVSDGEETSSVSFNATVFDVNTPPTVSLTNQTESLDENTQFLTPYTVADILIDDDALGTNSLSLSGRDAAQFLVSGNSLFLKTGVQLDFETSETLEVTVSVNDPLVGSDPDDSVDYTLGIVDVNEPPVGQDSHFTVLEDSETFRVQLSDLFTDQDENPVSWSVSSFSNPTLISSVRVEGNELLFLPAANQFGQSVISIQGMDALGLSDSIDIVATVTSVNDAPVAIAADDIVVEERSAPRALNVSNLFTDVEDDVLEFEITDGADAAIFSNVSLNPVTGDLLIEFADQGSGQANLTIVASDPHGATAMTSIDVIVEPDDPPVRGGSGVIQALEDIDPAPFDLTSLFIHANPVSLSFTVTSTTNPQLFSGSALDQPNGLLQLQLADNLSGVAEIVVVATDFSGNSAVNTIDVFVDAVNDAPIVVDSLNVRVLEDSADVTVNVSHLFDDIENDVMTFRVTQDSSAIVSDVTMDADTGDLSMSFAVNANGTAILNVSAIDSNGASTTTDIEVIVVPVSDPPIAQDDAKVVEYQPTVRIRAEDLLRNDSDPDQGDELQLIIVTQPADGEIFISNGVLSWYPTTTGGEVFSFQYVVSDGLNTSGVSTVTVEVNSLVPPFFGTPTPSVTQQTTVVNSPQIESIDSTQENSNSDNDESENSDLLAASPTLFSTSFSRGDDRDDAPSTPFLDNVEDVIRHLSSTRREETSEAYGLVISPKFVSAQAVVEEIKSVSGAIAESLDRVYTGLEAYFDSSGFEKTFERLDQDLNQALATQSYVAGNFALVTTSLSVGSIVWMLRSASLMMSLMTAMPAWRYIDPLPILDLVSDDDESLEAMVERHA